MPTLRGILKCLPAAVLGMLLMAWGVTQSGWVQINARSFVVELSHGSVSSYWQKTDDISAFWHFRTKWFDGLEPGRLRGSDAWGTSPYRFPIPLLITAVLPLAIGPFIRFRFRLWHYLAYTALVALELAYYLRWQN